MSQPHRTSIGKSPDQITCRDCGEVFEFTETHSEWFARRGLQRPKRCNVCRQRRRDQNVPTWAESTGKTW